MPARAYVYQSPARRALFRALDAVGDALLGSPRARAREAAPARGARAVVAIKLDHLGDLVLALPALHALRAGFPHARLHALVTPAAAPLLDGTGAADEVHTLAPTWLAGGRLPARGLARAARTLRALRPDVALVLRDDPFAILLARASGARATAGFGGAGLGFLLGRELAVRRGAHQVDLLVEAALAAGGAEPPTRTPRLHVTPAERARGRALSGGGGDAAGAPPICVHLGAGDPRKCWTPEGFAAAAGALRAEAPPGARREVVLLGSPGDRALADRCLAALGGKAVDLVGRTTLRETLGVLAEGGLLLAGDSGLAQMAAALGTPVVVAFASGVNDVRRWAPRGDRVAVVDMPYPGDPAILARVMAASQALLGAGP